MKKTDKIGVEIYLKQYEDMFKQYQELLNKEMGNHKDMLTSIMREQLDDLKDTYKLPMDKIREIEDRILAPKLKEQAEKAAQQAKKDAEDYLKKNQETINKALDVNKDSMKTLLETNNLVVESSKKALEDAKKAKEAIEKQDKKMKMDRVRGERTLKAQKARAEKESQMREEQAKSMYFEAAPSSDYEVINVPGWGHDYKHKKAKTAKMRSGKEVDLGNVRQLSVTKLASLITHNFEDFEALAKENAKKIADFESKHGKTPLDKDKAKELSDLKTLQREYEDANLNLTNAQKRGTAFHKVVELVEKSEISLDELTEDRLEELGKQYDEIGEGLKLQQRTKNGKLRSVKQNKQILDLVKKYDEFKKQAGLQGQTTTETPLGMLVDLGDEVVEVVGTFDSIFNEMSTLVDFKTSSRVDVKKIGIQLNLLKKMALLNPKFMKAKGIKGSLDALKVFHLPFRGGKGGVYDVGTADDAMMWQWIKSAFDILAGKTTEKPDVPVLMRGKLTLGEWQNKKKGTSGRQWLLNNISLNDLAKQYERGTMSYEEIMDNINSLNEEDRRHFINLIWSTKEYEEKKKTQRVFKVVDGKRVPLLDEKGNAQYDASGKPLYEMQDIVSSIPPRETGKLYRQGALWDKLRGDLNSFQKDIEGIVDDEYANISNRMTKIQNQISKIKISYIEAKEFITDANGNLIETTRTMPANEKEKAKENRRNELIIQREALREQLANQATSAFSEQVFKTDQGYGSAQTIGGGYLSEWAKAYRIHSESGDGLADQIANRFVSYILNAGLSNFQLDELKGGLVGIAAKDEANQAFVDAIQDRLLGKHSVIAPDLKRVQELESQIIALNQERASLDKDVLNPRIEEIDKLVQQLIAEQDRIKYAQEVGGIFTDEPIGINEMTEDYASEKGKKSAQMRGEAATNRAARMISRLRAFSEYDLSDKSFDDVMGFIKGLSGIRNEFKGFLNALGSDENSEIDEYSVPEYIEKSENILDAWTTFVRNLKNKVRGLENLDENQIEEAVQGLDISTGVQEDIGGLAKKTGHKLSWLYQLKDIYDEFLSPEMEEVNKSLSEKAKFTSVEQYAKSRLTQAQYEQYASSIDFRKSISEGKDFSTVISQFLDTPEFQLKSNLATALQKALAKIMEANPQLLDDTIYNIFMTQTDLGEGNKMKWWHGIGASERLRRGDVVRNWAYNPNEILTTKPEMIAEVEERAEEKLRNESSIRDAVESARIRAEQSAKEYNQKAFDIKKQITAQTGFDIEDYDKRYGFDKYENAYKKLYALAIKVGRGETDYKDFMRGELGGTRLSGETLQKYEELRKGLEIAQLQMGMPDDMSEEAKELFAKRQHLFEEYYIPSLRDKSYVSILRKRYGVKGDESDVLAQQAAVVNQIKSLPDQALLNTTSEINDTKNVDVDANSITVGEPEKVENNTQTTEIKADTVVVDEAEGLADAEKPTKRRGRPRKKKTENVATPSKPSDKMEVSSDGGTGGGDGGGKKPPKSGGRKGKSNEEKAQEQAVKEALKTEREYQQYLNQRFSLLSKIEAAQAKYNISIGKERAAAAGVIQTGNIELKYLDKRSEALIESMAHNQSARKAQMDYQQELKVATMQQQKLLGTKGAKSLWDVMANDIQRAAVRITDFGIAARTLNKIPQDIQKIIQYTKELDAAMTNIRIVGGYTEEQAKRLMRSYSELGNQLSATTTEIAQGMNDWLRQGYETEEQLEALVTASTKLSKLGMISASEATTALTSALKAFNLAAEDAIKVVDKLTKVDQLAAVSAGGISTALQKSATSAKLAGMSMDELIGSVSVIGEVTQQSMDTVGNAMKSILARYGNVKAGVFVQMGLNDDGETSENINDIEKVLSKLGIKVRSSAKEMRSITDVLDDVNSKWATFDTVTKNAIATAFGGTRMRENFLVLMENWNRVKELTEESANAAGTADEKYGAYTDSIEAGLKRVQNAWENMSQKFESSWLIKSGIGFMEQFVSHLDTITRLLTIFAATKFADKIFTFGANTVKGVPNILKRLTGLGTNSAGSVTYDEKGNMVVSPQETQRDFLIRKGTQTIVDTLNKNGIDTNSILNGIKLAIERTSLGAKAQYDPKTGKIISGLNVGGKDVTYVSTNASGERVFTYTKTGRKITSKKRLDDLNRQQDLIEKYNKNLGAPANPNQISGYTGQTWWNGAVKRVKIGDTEYYRNKKGKYISPIGAIVSPKQQKEIDELNKQLKQQRKAERVKAGVSAGATAVLSAFLTAKQVTQGDVSVEEDVLDKTVRAGLSGGLAAAGGAFLGPLGAMLGQTLGEGFAGMFSKWYHRDELAMKQRVADAKNNLSALGDIKTAIENNESLFNKTAYESEDYEKLKTYVDSLRKSFTDNDDLKKAFLTDVNKLGVGKYSTIEEVLQQITKGNVDINKQLQKQLELTTARLKVENTLGFQEEERAKISAEIGKDIKNDIISYKTSRVINHSATSAKGANTRGFVYDIYTSPEYIQLYTQLAKEGLISLSKNLYQTQNPGGGESYSERVSKLALKGESIEEQLENAEKVLERIRLEDNDTLTKKWEKIVESYREQVNKYTELNNELLETQVDYAYLTSDILNTKSRDEIRDLGMEGVVKIIRDELISQGVGVVDEQGIIHQDAYDAIVKKIRSDSTLYDYISKDIRSIGELISKDDIDGIESFARAFGLTTEAAKELGKQFGYLTQSMGLMNVQETTEYYEKLSTVFSNLSSNVALTAEQINSLLTTSELKDLLPYLMNQDDPDALIKELYKRIYGGGQDVHMENALYDATMGMSTDKFREYLQNKGLKEYVDEIDKGGYTTLSQIRDAVKEFDETDPRRQEFLKYLETINYTYSKDLTVLEKPSEYIKSQLEEQINNLQEQKDALSQINDEREKELNLIKAKQALEDARKEKKRVYRAGVGFSYESNEEAIVEAQKNLENLDVQKRQEDLQAQIDVLQMQKNIIEALPNQAKLEQAKKIWELLAADKGTKGSLASVTEGVSMLADAYANATNKMNMRAKTESVLNAPKEGEGMQTSDESTNPAITLNETQIEYTKTLVSDLAVIKNFLLYGAKSENFQEMLDIVKNHNMLQGDYARWGQAFSSWGVLDKWNSLTDEEKEIIRKQANTRAVGDTSFLGGTALINELGTEAVITPGGTLTALPSKTGIVPADITRNVWALGEVAPTLVAQLGSLTQKTLSGNAGNTTYEEGQYFDNFTMNVYPAKGDDFNKILEQARAQMRLTRHNN